MILGGAALLWIIGLVVMTAGGSAPGVAFDQPVATPSVGVDQGGLEKAAGPVEAEAFPLARPLDLARAADVCTGLSRVTAAAALPQLLGQAAGVLDAPGMIVWLGAGEELFPAVAHGYDPRVLARLGAIPRKAENATAAAWRMGELQTVSGDMVTSGALVAPLMGPDGAIGALAIETRDGRESDPSARAVAVMIAAQLAGIVSAWPAASAAETPAVEGPAAATA